MAVTRAPYFLGLVLYVISFCLCLLAYGTGYWYEGHGKSRLFDRLGLWEACFNGYEHTSDYIGKAYYGCWWILHKEYWYIRDWIMPQWFIAVQTFMTFAVVFEFLSIFTFVPAYKNTERLRVQCFLCFTVISSAVCLIISVVIFGSEIGDDRTWMPRFDINNLGWSFAFAVVAGFMAVFSGICVCIFTLMRKYAKLPREKLDQSKSSNVFAMQPKA